MHLQFDNLVLHEFKTFHGTHTFHLSNFNPGLHFIRGVNKTAPRLGSNGAGKSTLFDALTWCLYGRTVNGLRNPDLRPWKGKQTTTRVLVAVRINDKEHVIARTIAPNHLTVNLKEVGQEQVDQLLHMDFALFTNTVLLGQGQPLFFDLSPRDKMQLFVNALQLDRWDTRAQTAADRVSSLQENLMQLEGEKTGFKTALDELDFVVKSLQTKSDSWEQELQELTKEAQNKLKQIQKEAEAINKRMGKADLQLENAEMETRALEKLLIKQETVLLEADRVATKVNSYAEILQNQQNELKQELSSVDGDICPTCGQSLKGSALEKHHKKLRKKIDEINRELQHLGAKEQKAVKQAEDRVQQTRKHLEKFIQDGNAARDNYEYYTKQNAEIEASVKSLKEAMRERQSQTNPHLAQLRTTKKHQKELELDLRDVEDDIKTVIASCERAKFWVKGFKEVRLYVLEEILQELEFVSNAMLDEAGLVGWRISFLLEKETKAGGISRGLSILVRSPSSTRQVRWEAWSGGESQRLRIVGSLALAEVLLNHASVTPDLELLDEPTAHLSREGVADLCEYLADRARRLGKRICFVDHMAIESNRFASVITVSRDREGSHILGNGNRA